MLKKFKDITLVCISDVAKDLTIEAIETCKSYFEFADIKLFTSKFLDYEHAIEINPIKTKEDYNEFILTKLGDYIDTTHFLIIQYDGFIVNPEMWNDEWLELDYIGAPCLSNALTSQNGGFSLRSTKLIKEVNLICKDKSYKTFAEDAIIFVHIRGLLGEYKFATYEQAKKFSSEFKEMESFGFHSFRSNVKLTQRKIYNSKEANRRWNPNEKIAISTGCIGDMVHFLPTAHELGITKFSFMLNVGNHFNQQSYEVLKPLLESQGFKVDLWDSKPIYSPYLYTASFNKWFDCDEIPLTRTYANVFGTKLVEEPYLLLPKEELIYDIAIGVTNRYHDFKLDYGKVLKLFKDKKIVFVGTHDELREYLNYFPNENIKWFNTKDCLEAAKIINQSKVFIGNANGNMAIAQALKKPVIYEVSTQSHNAIPTYYPSYVVSKRNYHAHYMVDRILEFLEGVEK